VDIYDKQNLLNEFDLKKIWLFCNSSFFWLLRELLGRKNLGGGMLKAEAIDIKQINLLYDFKNKNKVEKIYQSLSKRSPLKIRDEVITSEHNEIDELITEEFGLTDRQSKLITDYLSEVVDLRENKNK
jgi:hypothetical protein